MRQLWGERQEKRGSEGEREERGKEGEERKRRGESVTARRYGGNMGRGGVCVRGISVCVCLCQRKVMKFTAAIRISLVLVACLPEGCDCASEVVKEV
jgi:hypothetical protein